MEIKIREIKLKLIKASQQEINKGIEEANKLLGQKVFGKCSEINIEDNGE